MTVKEGQNIFRCEYCGCYCQVETDAPDNIERPETPMPKGFTVKRSKSELKITRDWFNMAVIGITFFCLFWNGFMVMWFGITISQRIWMMAAFGSLHALIGLGVAYGVLAGWLNQTVVKVNSTSLEVTSGPIPVPGNKLLKTVDIKQLYSKEKTSRGESTSYSYEVHVVTYDKKDETLVAGLTDSAQALYIEQQIEHALGIKDRLVRGELER
jgi:hypothetical protein